MPPRKPDKTTSALSGNIYNIDLESESSRVRPSLADVREKKGTLIENLLIFLSYIICIILFPISIFLVFVTVRHFERVVILRNGRLVKLKSYGPGLVCYLPCVDSIKFIDLRIISHAVQPQEALTKDSLTVTVDAVVYYRVEDPVAAVINIADYKGSTKFIAAATLRNVIGTRKLPEILMNRRSLSKQINEHLKTLTSKWGVKIMRVEIKDIILPRDMQKAMAAEAESSRLANAKIKVAKAEIECTRSLLVATNTLMQNPEGMQIFASSSTYCWSKDPLCYNTVLDSENDEIIEKNLQHVYFLKILRDEMNITHKLSGCNIL